MTSLRAATTGGLRPRQIGGSGSSRDYHFLLLSLQTCAVPNSKCVTHIGKVCPSVHNLCAQSRGCCVRKPYRTGQPTQLYPLSPAAEMTVAQYMYL